MGAGGAGLVAQAHERVAALAQVAQQRRQHGGGLPLGVVEQDDAVVVLRTLDEAEHTGALLVRRHLQPVSGPQVGAEDGEMVRVEIGEQILAVGKAGKAEEGRRRHPWRGSGVGFRGHRCFRRLGRFRRFRSFHGLRRLRRPPGPLRSPTPSRPRRPPPCRPLYPPPPPRWTFRAGLRPDGSPSDDQPRRRPRPRARTSAGCAVALRPMRKKVACRHSAFSASSTAGVVCGQGPSSKVRITSLSASASVRG